MENDQLRAAVRYRQTRICLWHSSSAFEHPQRFNVRLQFLPGFHERKLHLRTRFFGITRIVKALPLPCAATLFDESPSIGLRQDKDARTVIKEHGGEDCRSVKPAAIQMRVPAASPIIWLNTPARHAVPARPRPLRCAVFLSRALFPSFPRTTAARSPATFL